MSKAKLRKSAVKSKKGFSKFRSKWWALCEIERQIRRGKHCTGPSLAGDLEVDPRTIRRYIAFMRDDMGAPIEFDPIDETYVLTDQTWTMPNVHLSDEELVALGVAIRSISGAMPIPFIEPLTGLMAKLLDALPEATRREILSLQARIDFVPASINSKGQQWIEPLMGAIRDERSIEMTYYLPGRGKETRRKLDPYHLRFFAGAWYLVGYDHPTKHFPLFNLARIRKLEVLEDGFRRQKFSPEEYFRHSVGISVGAVARPVRLLLSGRAAATASERIWPNGFAYEPRDEQSGILSGTLSRLDDLLAWVASVGGAAAILAEEAETRL